MKKPLDLRNIKTIGVFVGEDLLGDGLLKYPFVSALKDAFPKAHLTWISGHKKSIYGSLLAPLVKGKIDTLLDKDIVGSSWTELWKPKIKSFDLFINTHRYFKTTVILKSLKHKCFIDPSHNFFFSDIKPTTKEKPTHITDQLLSLVSLVTSTKPKATPIALDAKMQKEVTPLFKKGKVHVALSPGAGQPKKQWPLENFLRVALEQVAKNRVPVFILGPAEAPWHAFLKEAVPEALFPLQDHPDFLKNPLYTTALTKCCKIGIANDSGTGHLMGLAHIPLISLFGPTASAKLHPYTPKLSIMSGRDFGHATMEAIPLETVLETIETMIEKYDI